MPAHLESPKVSFEAVAGYLREDRPGNPERVIQRISGMYNVAARPDGKREHVTLGLGKEKRMELKNSRSREGVNCGWKGNTLYSFYPGLSLSLPGLP